MDNFSEALQQLLYDFLAFLPDFATALIIFFGSVYLAGLISKIMKRTLERRKTDSAFVLLLVKIARYTMIGFGAFTALQQVGFNLTAFLAGLGILGFTLGFALQDVSKNFVSGLLLLLEQPFDKGDVINVADQFGTVSKTDLRTTELYTFDGQTVTIPNGDVFTNSITNYSRYPKRRMDMTVGVAYGSDLELVRKAAFEAVETVPGLINDPPPFVIFKEFGDSSIKLKIYCWINLNETGYFRTQDALITGVDAAFHKYGIQIPFPIRSVHLEKYSSNSPILHHPQKKNGSHF